MAHWSVEQVICWLNENGFSKHTKIFKEKRINGHALMQLTDDDIAQLLMQVNNDGIVMEPSIGSKSRFRTRLMEWRVTCKQQNYNRLNIAAQDSPKIPRTTSIFDDTLNESHEQRDIDSKKIEVKLSNEIQREQSYLVDDIIHIRFFNNRKFLSHFINYVKKQSFPANIDIAPVNSTDDILSGHYVVKLTGKKKENRLVRRCIKDLLASIKMKEYHQKNVRKWIFHSTPIHLIQNLFDNENQLFTVCRLNESNRFILEVYYFDNDQFCSSNALTDIETVIQTKMLQCDILLSFKKGFNLVEVIEITSRKVLSSYNIIPSKQYEKELNESMNLYKQDNMLISVTKCPCTTNKQMKKDIIRIIGDRQYVDEVFLKLNDLFNKHRLRKLKLSHVSSSQLDCLMKFYSNEIHCLAGSIPHDYIVLKISDEYCYAPQYLKDEIQTCIMDLLSTLKIKSIRVANLYNGIAENLTPLIKHIAQRNNCYCEFELKTKLKPYPIPKSTRNDKIMISSKFTVEESKMLLSSPLVFQQATLSNGSIEVLMDDICLQKVDFIVVPSMLFGLKEYLMERAGEIVEEQSFDDVMSKNKTEFHSTPFITQTTGGRLNCRKVLLVNCLLPQIFSDDDDRSIDSIRLFISKSMQHIIKEAEKLKLNTLSIAFAVPDSCEQANVLAEEMIEETISQIYSSKSVTLKVSFVLSPEQTTLHQQFSNTLQMNQSAKDSHGILQCPSSTLRITLISTQDDSLAKCEEKINRHLNNYFSETTLAGFQDWDQFMINAFYRYSMQLHVYMKMESQLQILLYGPVYNVYQVVQQHQLIDAIARTKTALLSRSSANEFLIDYNIMLSYSLDDSEVVQRLASRLVEEGFTVMMHSNPFVDFNTLSRKLDRVQCAILCISENYLQNKLCEKEAKCIDEYGQRFVPVKIQNTEPNGWLRKLIDTQTYFQVFGSNFHFNFGYERLLLKILTSIRNDSISTMHRMSTQSTQTKNIKSTEPSIINEMWYFLLTTKEKRSKYKNYVKTLLRLGNMKIDRDERSALIEKMQDIIHENEHRCDDFILKHRQMWHLPKLSHPAYERKRDKLKEFIQFDFGVLSQQQYLTKIETSETTINIAPFTVTGDINDASFPVLNGTLQNSRLLLSLRQHYSVLPCNKVPSKSITVKSTKPLSERQRKIPSKHQQKSVIKVDTHATDSQSKPNRMSGANVARSTNKRRAPKIKNEKHFQINQQYKILSKKSILTDVEKIKLKQKFVEQHRKNQYELEMCCKNDENTLSQALKQNIRDYPAALFGPSPFSSINDVSIRTARQHQTLEMPVKFPWNGVFDRKKATLQWINPCALFRYQTASLIK